MSSTGGVDCITSSVVGSLSSIVNTNVVVGLTIFSILCACTLRFWLLRFWLLRLLCAPPIYLRLSPPVSFSVTRRVPFGRIPIYKKVPIWNHPTSTADMQSNQSNHQHQRTLSAHYFCSSNYLATTPHHHVSSTIQRSRYDHLRT